MLMSGLPQFGSVNRNEGSGVTALDISCLCSTEMKEKARQQPNIKTKSIQQCKQISTATHAFVRQQYTKLTHAKPTILLWRVSVYLTRRDQFHRLRMHTFPGPSAL